MIYISLTFKLGREEDEDLSIFNRRFYSSYHDMPLEIRPTETTTMIYYVMSLHSELALLLLERKYSSLRSLFEDAQELEENIHASRMIREWVYFENMQAHEQAECHYISNF